ncbi:Uncharacterised protein [Mesomycoplasma hyorhinis]|nr:Uncharacterised protein [Mesomycoplasma hyorhinis]
MVNPQTSAIFLEFEFFVVNETINPVIVVPTLAPKTKPIAAGKFKTCGFGISHNPALL